MCVSSLPLRIGLLTPAWPGSKTANGVATVVAHLTAGLEACGHEVTVLPFSIDAPHDFPRVVSVPQLRLRLLDRLRMRFGPDPEGTMHHHLARRVIAAVREAIARHGIEVLVMEESHGWASTISRHVPIPLVLTLHGPWCLHKTIQGNGDAGADARRETRERLALHHARGITSPSQDTLERTAAIWSLPALPRAVIRNPMSVPPAPADGGPERLMFVGRFDFHKGGDVVIDAFAQIARRHPSCRLTFVGPDRAVARPGHAALALPEALARLPGAVQARIDVRGECSREEVAALRRTHGLTIVASRYENFGGTMLEAMAAGSALVCTRIGGGAEILLDGETALLVPPDDAGALAEACLRLLGDPALARRLGRAARAYVESHLSPEAIGRQMADFLTPLCRR